MNKNGSLCVLCDFAVNKSSFFKHLTCYEYFKFGSGLSGLGIINKEVIIEMKKVIIQCLLTMVLFTSAAAGEKPPGMKEYTSVDELATAISSYFPRVQGEVKAVAGDQLTVALGTKDGLRQGVVLAVWRDGREILHPVTSMVIGRIEEEVGSLEMTVVGETTSTGVMKKKSMTPKVGDKARITPKKIGLALVPLRDEHPEIIQGLAGRDRKSVV